MAVVYKICSADQWEAAGRSGVLPWAEVDARDGYMHLSSAEQVGTTARLHFGGRADLWLVAIDATRLGDALRWEPSRGGALFPHLYGALSADAIVDAAALPPDGDGGWHWPPWCQPAAGGSDSARTPDAPAKP